MDFFSKSYNGKTNLDIINYIDYVEKDPGPPTRQFKNQTDLYKYEGSSRNLTRSVYTLQNNSYDEGTEVLKLVRYI